LPDRAFTYLRSHGSLDQQHVGHLASIVNKLDAQDDMPAVVACAKAMYWLYGGVFRGLDSSPAAVSPESWRKVACS
jgi:pyrroloquinoline quinone (PQQ) biosynthesis protein C